MSSFTQTLPHLFTGFSGAVLVWLHWYARSLCFYWRNGWDFSVDFGPLMSWGDEFHSSENEIWPRPDVHVRRRGRGGDDGWHQDQRSYVTH